MVQRMGNDLSHVPVSAINGIRDTYAGTVDYTEVSPNTLAGAGWGSPTTKAVVSVHGLGYDRLHVPLGPAVV